MIISNFIKARLIFISIFLFFGCKEYGNNAIYIDWSKPYTQITIDCVDKVALGANIKAVVNTKEEYDSLLYIYYQKPLDDWRKENFASLLATVRRNRPGLSDSEYLQLAEEMLYQFYPFMGTKGCTIPEVDFSNLTLLGYGTDAIGCFEPEYFVEVETNHAKKTSTLHVTTVEHGCCDMLHSKIIWVLVPKLPSYYNVEFVSKSINLDCNR